MDLDDKDYDYEEQQPTASDMASRALETLLAEGALQKKKLTDEEAQELAAQQRDTRLWENELPETATEAKFWGNLGLRLTKGISNAEINDMTVSERINSATRCFNTRQLLLEKPTTNINWDTRNGMAEALPALMKEVERRQREKMTVDITPGGGES